MIKELEALKEDVKMFVDIIYAIKVAHPEEVNITMCNLLHKSVAADLNNIEYVLKKQEQDQDKLKALEIVKNKGCSYIEVSLIVSCDTYEEYCSEMNSGRVYLNGYECEKAFKTQEEYDTVKKALL